MDNRSTTYRGEGTLSEVPHQRELPDRAAHPRCSSSWLTKRELPPPAFLLLVCRTAEYIVVVVPKGNTYKYFIWTMSERFVVAQDH